MSANKVYLMSAFHIDGFNRIKVEKIAQQEPNCRLAVYGQIDGSWKTFAMGHGIDKSQIGSYAHYIKDTGMGYGHVSPDRTILQLVNVIDIVDGKVSSANDIGMASAHSLKVYK